MPNEPHAARRACRVVRRGLLILLLAVGAFPAEGRATTITVPDQAPTIQAGIDSGADEVLVRPGSYPESPVIARPVILRGLVGADSTDLPETLGLTLSDAHMQSVSRITVAFMHFRGPVRHVFTAYVAGPYYVDFSDCVVDSGITDQSPGWDQFDASILRCRIAGGVELRKPEEIHLANNVIQGPLRLHTTNGLYAIGNSIEGPGSAGIHATFQDQVTLVVGNTVRGFDVGISLGGNYGTDVRDNLVEDCQAGIVIYDDGDFRHSVTGNTVRSCGYSINVNAGESVILTGNLAEDCASGIFAAGGSVEVRGNRVSKCGTGLTAESFPMYVDQSSIVSRDNLVEGCGSGLTLLAHDNCVADRDTIIDSPGGILLRSEKAYAAVDSALVLLSRGAGITIEAPWATATRCVVGRSASDGFRLSVSNGVTLSFNTSFLNGGTGFVVDGLGAATGGVAGNIGFGNLQQGLSADPGTALQLSCNDWYGNLAGATGGLSPGATDLAVHPGFCDLPANDVHLVPGSPLADAPGCGPIGAHGVACDGEQTTGVIDRTPAVSGFALARVGPVPTRGPIALEWTLPHAAAIDVAVHDIQGRAVARIADGGWPAGRHAIEWNGMGARGPLPPGLYMVRYRFPGGESSRRIVISR